MKKTLLFAAVVAMTLAACSKNESTEIPGVSDDTKSINFATSTGITRANNNDIEVMKGYGFEVYGMTKVNTDAPELLFKTAANNVNAYEWQSANTAWGWISPDVADKKWPTDPDVYPLQFFAVFPKSYDVHTRWSPNYSKSYADQNWTMPVGENKEGGLIPFLSAIESQEDYLVAISEAATTVPTNGLAALNFKHILSNILFSIVTPENYKVYIQDLKLKNIGGSAGDATYRVFDVDPLKRGVWEEAAAGDRTASFSYFSDMYIANPKATVTGVAGNAAVQIYSDPTDETTKKISPKLMPQANTNAWSKAAFKALYDAWVAAGSNKGTYQTEVLDKTVGAYIEVTYAMVDADNVCVVGQVKDAKNPADKAVYAANQFVTVAFPLDFATTPWVQGKKYMYNLRLGMPDSSNGVIMDPNYKDENGGGTDKPVDNPANPEPGEDVTDTDRRIDFTVGVSEWADGAGTDIK